MQPATSLPLLPIFLFLAAAAILFLVLYLKTSAKLRAHKSITDLQAEAKKLTDSLQRLTREGGRAQEEMDKARARFKEDTLKAQAEIDSMQAELLLLREQMDFVEHGLYEPLYDFDSSERYAAKLTEIREEQKVTIKNKTAVLFFAEWTVEGSRAKGRKVENEYSRLMLRAFNGECDALITKVRYNNIRAIEKRMATLYEAVNKLGATYKCQINRSFYRLKVNEMHLVHEYQEKKQAEAEEQRQIREQMREEERAMREIERAIMDAEREEARYEKALEKARYEAEKATGAKHVRLEGEIERLQALLDEAHQNRERAKSRAEMTRSGYVYIISR